VSLPQPITHSHRTNSTFNPARMETEKLSVAVQDTLVCLEMPLFAFLHLYAFSREFSPSSSLTVPN
jgi:hypothetical protein